MSPSRTALAGDGGQDVEERSLRCFSESNLEVRLSLGPKNRLPAIKPAVRVIGHVHDEILFRKSLQVTESEATEAAISATLSSGGKRRLRISLPTSSAKEVVSAGGDCYRVRIEKLEGTLSLLEPIPTLAGELPAGTGPVSCLLETQFESGCE